MSPTTSRRRFGQITKMRSGRWQARFTVPLDHPSGRPATFDLEIEGAAAAGPVVVGGPGVAEHVRAEVADATTGLQAVDRKSTRLNSSHSRASRMPSSA